MDKIDIKKLAENTDIYDLLGLKIKTESEPFDPPSYTESELRRAYRKTALKYHPDKNSSSLAEEKFHLLSLAYDILNNPDLKNEYNQTRSAFIATKLRTLEYDAKRKQMKDDLELREKQAAENSIDNNIFNNSSTTNKSTSTTSYPKKNLDPHFAQRLQELKKHGAELRRKRENEYLSSIAKKKALDKDVMANKEKSEKSKSLNNSEKVSNEDSNNKKTVKIRWRRFGKNKKNTTPHDISSDELKLLFSQFGPIEHAIINTPSVDNKKQFQTGVIVFHSEKDAQSAVNYKTKLNDNKIENPSLSLEDVKDVIFT